VAGVFFFADLRLKKSVDSDGSALQPLVAAVQLVLPDGRCYELTDEGTVQEIVAVAEKRNAFDSHEQQFSADTTVAPVVEYGEIIVPKGKGYTLKLADRSVVTLNAESRIKFPTRFTEAERRIVLNGEAYFDVARDEAHPFVVEFAEGAVRVLGTEFNIKAYEGQHTCATLVEGRVEVLAADETVVLQPGELCEILPEGLSVCEADLMSVLAWKNGEFVFKEASWQQVAEELERWYDVEMVYDVAEMADMKLHIYMERPETLAEALEVIARIARFDYSVQGRKVIINKR
ncbi:MAG: FecR domain-containing protein, partial [Odoribacter sp.]|nr:FecR domain-containing protein [Odoribacter sp.]